VPDNGTLGGQGCAVAAAAMVFKFYGIETDPQQLNWFLTAVDGYTDRGWLYWDRAAWLAPDRVRHVYEDLPSYQLIDSNLAHGNPVIVRVRLTNGITHFVVVAGKDGFDYLVRDPGGGAAKGFYPLRECKPALEPEHLRGILTSHAARPSPLVFTPSQPRHGRRRLRALRHAHSRLSDQHGRRVGAGRSGHDPHPQPLH